jgi:predicted tellurium resistance membrane protein TerC
LALIDRIPELETSAYILILLISAKMFAGVFGVHVSHITFFIILLLVFGATFIVHFMNKKKEVGKES